jgi:hypothetical protein
MVWTIEAKILPLVGVSGHLYLEIFDDNGVRICQINGLATDPKNGRPNDIGLPGDLLRAYVGNFVLGDTTKATRDNHPHEGRVLFQGDAVDMFKAIDAAKKAADYINQMEVPYRLLRLNSNSVFSHMVKAMSVVIPIDKQALKEVCGLKKILPGVNGKITDKFKDAASKKTPPTTDKKPPPPPAPPAP